MLRSSPLDLPDREPMLSSLAALRAGLRDQGYVDGQNFTIDYRLPRTDANEDVAAQARDLVRLSVDVIHAGGPQAVQAASRATTTLPILAHDYETDPVDAGLIESVRRPGRNITGMFLDLPELNGKFLELLKAAVPRLVRVAALWDPTTGRSQVRAARQAAKTLGLDLPVFEIRAGILEKTIHAAKSGRAGALLLLSSPLTGASANQDAIARAAIQDRLPSICLFHHFAIAGGLMSYGTSGAEVYRQEGRQLAAILNGAKPADLPIERPTKFVLAINLRTAKALGLELPPSLLLRADEIIQ
jgi:putative ABC transport system substrate-binding protein